MSIQEKVESLLSSVKSSHSVLCQDLDAEEPSVSINPDTVFSSASVIKVPILMTLISHAQALQSGNPAAVTCNIVGRGFPDAPPPCKTTPAASLDSFIDVTEILDDTQVFEYGPRPASLRELAVWMTVLSDNTSTNALIDALGFDAVNGFIASLGLRQTALRRKMLDFASRAAGIDNETSARDMFVLFRHMFREGRREFSEAADILRRQRAHDKLTRYIWEDATLAHKTGGLDYLTHDAGVFSFKGKDVFAGVFLWDTEDIKGDDRLIGRVGRLIYDYYA